MKWRIERLTNESYVISFEYRNEIQHLEFKDINYCETTFFIYDGL